MSDTQTTETRSEQAIRLASEIVEECRVQLALKFRFLDVALWRMDARPALTQGRYALSTDGTHVYFEPYTVIGRFDAGFAEIVRDYLHLVMHCLFRHPFDASHANTEAWWLACDVIAENAAMELCGERFASGLDGKRREAVEELTRLCAGKLSPGNLYGLFLRSQRAQDDELTSILSGGRLNELRTLFERDFHKAWPSRHVNALSLSSSELPPEEEGTRESDGRDMSVSGESSEQDEDRPDIWNPNADNRPQAGQDASDDAPEFMGQDGQDSNAPADQSTADTGGGQADDSKDETSSDAPEDEDAPSKTEPSEEEGSWEEISKQVEMDLETFSKDWGYEAGDFMKTLTVANRKTYDYDEFLRRFAVLSEEMEVNDDEFDYIFYTYGLRLYGNLPLIEPLEYKETRRIRDFVICIDTSESCEGELVQKFVEHTFSVLKRQEDYSHKVNIHLIQCDAKVQSDVQITDLRQVDRLMDDFHIRGLGGTDFRPAFSYVDDLRRQEKLNDLQGLIYFTDGLGEFPEVAPDYDAAFVFMDQGEARLPAVPPWAMRIVVDEEGIERLARTSN
jgi:predicted metal-dependent peptidase